MRKDVIEDFELIGHDNVLLNQVNPFSVVSVSKLSIIATANTQHLFRLLAEGGKDFIQELRQKV